MSVYLILVAVWSANPSASILYPSNYRIKNTFFCKSIAEAADFARAFCKEQRYESTSADHFFNGSVTVQKLRHSSKNKDQHPTIVLSQYNSKISSWRLV